MTQNFTLKGHLDIKMTLKVTSTQNEGFEPVHGFTTPVFVFMAECDVSDVTGPCRCLNHLTFLGNLLHYHDFPR